MKKYDKAAVRRKYSEQNSMFEIEKPAKYVKSDISAVNLGGIVFWMLIALISFALRLF